MRCRRASAAARAIGVAAALALLGAACSPGAGGVRPGAATAATATTTAAAPTDSALPAGDPGAFGFTFEQEVAAGAESWALAASGRVVGDGLTCRVRASGPGVAFDRDLVLIGARLWARDHGDGEYREIGGGNPAERALLAYCPAWPPTADAAGLTGLVTGEPARHSVAGVEALGYRADEAGLAAAVGADLGAAAVGVFNFWIAADGAWVVEVNLSVSGPGADLAPLLGSLPVPVGRTTMTARHRLDLGVAADPILPPA